MWDAHWDAMLVYENQKFGLIQCLDLAKSKSSYVIGMYKYVNPTPEIIKNPVILYFVVNPFCKA